jgi:hypothetical protein
MKHPLAFAEWYECLIRDATVTEHSYVVNLIGSRVLELFWQQGCEPNCLALLANSPPVHGGEALQRRSLEIILPSNQLDILWAGCRN